MMDDKYHKGYRVSVKSSLTGTRWRPDVQVKSVRGAATAAVSIGPAPAYWSAATEEAADLYGFDMAKAWIDQELD